MQAFTTVVSSSTIAQRVPAGLGYSSACSQSAAPSPAASRASSILRTEFFASSPSSLPRFFASVSGCAIPLAHATSQPAQRFQIVASEEVAAPEEAAAAPLKTYITCPSCGASYTIAKDAIPVDGREVKCGKCDYQWYVKAEELKELATNQRFRRFVAAKDIFNIYVGNLSFKANEDDLMQEFSRYGEVHRVSIPLDKETGRSRGFAFVEMLDKEAGRKAAEELNGTSIAGREVSVSEAKPKAPSNNNYRRDRR
eukprot:tig00001694_g9566.t1